MPIKAARKTPGVYVTELDAFPPSVVGIQTAVPAFIGYTQTATLSGKPIPNTPVRIGSLADYEQIFGGAPDPTFNLTEVTDTTKQKSGGYDFKVLDAATSTWKYYDLVPTAGTKYILFNSLRLFYANGGGTAYVVSVGGYSDPLEAPKLVDGLNIIAEQVGPTMLVVPDAVNLATSADYGTVATAMLNQCGKLQDRVALLDVYGGATVTQTTLETVESEFRGLVGSKFLNYGMAYFPFLHTNVQEAGDFDYTNIKTDQQLQDILKLESANLYANNSARKTAVDADIAKIGTLTDPAEIQALNQNLTAALPLLADMLRIISRKDDVLPATGALAGVYTWNDANRGVWNAPANVSLAGVTSTTFKLNNEQQENLNVPVDGKAINALREFVGRGTVVWGARTLDGNSNDWRYIQVRRTLVYAEQSIKSALDRFVFAANDGNTWASVVSMVSSFLQGLWSQGGLLGATASDAFSVECGLGSTMTAQDVLEGYMVVQVTLQMIRPAEFIELTFKQKMEGASA
ncbi:phage tail sheath subtilisin-like domain-containing protein [Myxococcus sp. K15C18031901]|uniref:phage tail sheath family protein n=1 Tax=Myxococcus dinghuensis TaxID=2906761 RepID=UPI0020A8197C|nr:phage tail sheath C-terminal domain-containing protein [Myxococcus dinghuensis]MCP3100290.1 phage tail sheath subtilisin-like domain-containing protein [Myxococcus dinghuensis]